MNQRGVALIVVLVLLTLMLPLGAAAVLETRLQAQMSRNRRARSAAFEVAEAGLSHAIAESVRAVGPQALFNPADAIPRIGDTRSFPFRTACFTFPAPRTTYDVTVTAAGPSLLRLVSQGRSSDLTATVANLLEIGPPFSPAAVFTNGIEVTSLPASYSVAANNGALALHAMSGTDDPPLAIKEVVTLLRSHRERSLTTVVTDATDLGDAARPRLLVASAGLSIETSASGSGVLVVGGTLRLHGSLRYRGLVIVTGGGELEADSSLDVQGSLWIDQPSESERLAFNGAGAIRYDAAALLEVDRAIPLAIPRRLQASGWEEGE